MRDVELVVFDVAGTTIRDGGQVADAFHWTLAGLGVTITPQELAAWRGASKRLALAHFVKQQLGDAAPEMLEQIYARFCDRLTRRFADDGVEAIGGVEQTFAALRGRGVRLALTSGFEQSVLDLLLKAVGWHSGVVDAVVSGDQVPQGRPAPYMIFRAMERTGVMDVRRVVNVGDTVLDLQSGSNAGVGLNLGVLSGAHGREQLEAAPHTHILGSVAELPELLFPRAPDVEPAG